MLGNLTLVLVKTRFPENIGMAARACANMGCPNILLVAPERYEFEKAKPLATTKGAKILKNLKVFPTLRDALSGFHSAFCATARNGGWRKNPLYPWDAARQIIAEINQNRKVALVLGPEHQGLTNKELAIASGIIHIPTVDLSSLNLAQAALLLLYECLKEAKNFSGAINAPKQWLSLDKLAILEENFQGLLKKLHCLQGKNQDYAFIQYHQLLARLHLRENEFAALMGLCRQLENMLINPGKGSLPKCRNFHDRNNNE